MIHLNNSKKFKYSIIIPCYNEDETIEQIIINVQNLIKLKTIDAEIIVVNDGSTDNSKKFILKHEVKLIDNLNNSGLGASLKNGILNSKSDFVVFIDSDGQHKISDLENIILHSKENDIVISERPIGSDFSKFRAIGKFIIRLFLIYLTGKKIIDFNSGLRAIKRNKLLKILNLLPDRFSFVTTSLLMFIHLNEEIKFVSIYNKERTTGKSFVNIFSFFSTFAYLINLSIIFKPLKIFVPFSLTIILFGFIFLTKFYLIEGVIGVKSIILISFGFVLLFIGYILSLLVDIKLQKYSEK